MPAELPRGELVQHPRAQRGRERRVRVTSASMSAGVMRAAPLDWLSRRIARSASRPRARRTTSSVSSTVPASTGSSTATGRPLSAVSRVSSRTGASCEVVPRSRRAMVFTSTDRIREGDRRADGPRCWGDLFGLGSPSCRRASPPPDGAVRLGETELRFARLAVVLSSRDPLRTCRQQRAAAAPPRRQPVPRPDLALAGWMARPAVARASEPMARVEHCPPMRPCGPSESGRGSSRRSRGWRGTGTGSRRGRRARPG